MIWLVGNKGMLGTEVETVLNARRLRHCATDAELDITDPMRVSTYVDSHRPDWIINCAAYTDVDRAEQEEALANTINVTGSDNLAREAVRVGARFVHISTDYVFDGNAAEPYREDAPANPAGAYGRTKAQGESAVREACEEHFIVRTAWLYGVHGKNFVETMIRLMGERDEVRVVNDQLGSPTYAVDLANAIVEFVAQDSRAFGNYHFTNEGECTWFDFARAIQDEAIHRGVLHSPARLTSIATSEYPTPAKRPAYSVLSKERIKAHLGIRIPSWQDGLVRYFEQRTTLET